MHALEDALEDDDAALTPTANVTLDSHQLNASALQMLQLQESHRLHPPGSSIQLLQAGRRRNHDDCPPPGCTRCRIERLARATTGYSPALQPAFLAGLDALVATEHSKPLQPAEWPRIASNSLRPPREFSSEATLVLLPTYS